MNQETRAQLVAAFLSGSSVTELQQRFGLSKGSVLRLLHEAEVRMHRQSVGREQLGEVIRLYESGLSIRQVAAHLGALLLSA